jgi:hypothetical protein
MKRYNNAKRTILVLTLILLITFSAFSQEMKLYENKKLGFSVEYPENWELEDQGMGVGISTSNNFIDEGNEGVGFAILSIPSPPEAEGSAADFFLNQLMKESGMNLEKSNTVPLAGVDWNWNRAVSEEKNLTGEFYFLENEGKVVIIFVLYHPRGEEKKYGSIIDTMLNTFQFIATVE